MSGNPVQVTKKGPGLAQIERSVRRLRSSEVLVGIPAAATQREGDPVNNASLMFIHTHGSELQHIPPRPVLEPAVAANKELITAHLEKAAKDVLQKRPDAADRELNLAGTIASSAAKRWFTDPRNGWAPNAPATIAAKGSDRPLIDQGLLRRSITFVVRVNS